MHILNYSENNVGKERELAKATKKGQWFLLV